MAEKEPDDDLLKMPSLDEALGEPASRIAEAVIRIISEVPKSRKKRVKNVEARSRELIAQAAWEAAAVSGGLALPPGPMGLLTIMPELILVWKLQAKLVADLAAVRGKTPHLSREVILYCLFRHVADHALRDVAVRVGQRMLVRRASLSLLRKIAEAIGVKVTQRVARSAVARWLPIVGAAGIGAYSYYDTATVGETAAGFLKDLGPASKKPSAEKQGPVVDVSRGRRKKRGGS